MKKFIFVVLLIGVTHSATAEKAPGYYQDFFSSRKNAFNPLKAHFYTRVYYVNELGQETGVKGIGFVPEDRYIRREGAMPLARSIPGQNLPIDETINRDLDNGRDITVVTIPITAGRYLELAAQSDSLTANPPMYRGLFNKLDPNATNCRQAVVESDGRTHRLGPFTGRAGANALVNDAYRNGYTDVRAPGLFQRFRR